MPETDHFYGGRTLGAGRTVQDFGLCDLKGQYLYTAKARAKGLLVVVFFAPDSPPSVRALEEVQRWTDGVPKEKWSAVAVADSDRDTLAALAEQHNLTGLTFVIDHELYQTRTWGVSHLPSTFLIAGRTGRILQRIMGSDPNEFGEMGKKLEAEVGKLVAADEAAKKAEEEKKAAEAAKK